MADPDLARLIVRHRHVAPMLSALLSGTNAGVRMSDADGTVILEREATRDRLRAVPDRGRGPDGRLGRGDRVGRAIASVLSYAVAREADKRSLAREALDRYRELNLVYDLAEKRLSGELAVSGVAAIAIAEAGRLPAGGSGFLLLADGAGGLDALAGAASPDSGPAGGPVAGGRIGEGVAIAASAVAEEVNDVDTDPRSTPAERTLASLICAPVVARGRTIGVLGAGSSTRIEYQAADLKLIAAIAAIVGRHSSRPGCTRRRAHRSAERPAREAAPDPPDRARRRRRRLDRRPCRPPRPGRPAGRPWPRSVRRSCRLASSCTGRPRPAGHARRTPSARSSTSSRLPDHARPRRRRCRASSSSAASAS